MKIHSSSEKIGILLALVCFIVSSAARATQPAEPTLVRIPEPSEVLGPWAKEQWSRLMSDEPLSEDEQLSADRFISQIDPLPWAERAMKDPVARRALALILGFQPPPGKEKPFTPVQLGTLLTSPNLGAARIPQLLTDIWILMYHPGIKLLVGSMSKGPKEFVKNPRTLIARQVSSLSVAAELYERNQLKSILPKIDGTYVDMTIKGDESDKIVMVFSRSRPEVSNTQSELFARWIGRNVDTANRSGHKLAVVFLGHYNDGDPISKLIAQHVEVFHKPYGKRLITVRH